MTAAGLVLAAQVTSPERIAAVVAQMLRVPASSIPFDMPLSRLGIDSLGCMELAAEIEGSLGRSVPAEATAECATVQSLCEAVNGTSPQRRVVDVMRADAQLPPDISPTCTRSAAGLHKARNILLTGATGFLGRSLLKALVEGSPAQIVCLVRPTGDRATHRLHRLARDLRIPAHRIEAVEGDLAMPQAGLLESDWRALRGQIDAVCHAGASINWVSPYAALRDVNVCATRDLLRLASEAGASFHFVSSISVCYSTSAPALVDESFAALNCIDGLHFGYAQTKAIAEALVRRAHARGLRTRIYRPSIICGDSHSGHFNADDLLSRLIAGCVRMGTVPDLDWHLDAVPVDSVADAIVRLSRCRSDTWHLTHPRPRHWCECALWMRIYGYDVRLVPYRDWTDQLRHDVALDPDHPLRPLRAFFLDRSHNGFSIPELHEAAHRPTADARASLRALSRTGGQIPPLTADLMDRYFAAFVREGVLPAPAGLTRPGGFAPPAPPTPSLVLRPAQDDPELRRRVAGAPCPAPLPPSLKLRRAAVALAEAGRRGAPVARLDVTSAGETIGLAHATCVGRTFRSADGTVHPAPLTLVRDLLREAGLNADRVSVTEAGSDQSIIGELTAWRSKSSTGLFHVDAGGRALLLKLKPHADEAIAVGESLAYLCGERLGAEYARWGRGLGLELGHAREIAIYQDADPCFRSYLPDVIATRADHGTWAVLMERITPARPLDALSPRRWRESEVDVAVDGLTALHARWCNRVDELRTRPWMTPARTTADLRAMETLWRALAEHDAPLFAASAGASLPIVHERLIESIGDWRPRAEAIPQTLIHNDFNPRNICLREARPFDRSAGSRSSRAGSRDDRLRVVPSNVEGRGARRDPVGRVFRPGERLRLCVFDWELATIGPPTRDLAELLCFVSGPHTARELLLRWLDRHRLGLSRATGVSIDAASWEAAFASALCELLIDRLTMYALVHRVKPQPFLPRVLRTWSMLHGMFRNALSG